jgi:hypothetical protein
MPPEGAFMADLASPFTPQKPTSNSPPLASQLNQSRSKPRNPGSKPRAKQVSSPGTVKQDRMTPPQTVASKPIAAPAFAGATFHASPAPSSLPIPSFAARALDSPSLRKADRANREPSPPVTDSEAPTPQHRLPPTDVSQDESPLDILFRAHRAEKEKERARRASCADILAVPNAGPSSPLAREVSPQVPKTLPSVLGTRIRRSGGISPSELDGTPGRPLGPAFSTPYQDRIRAALSSYKQATSPPQHQEAEVDLSEKLKRFLAVSPRRGEATVSPRPDPVGEPYRDGPVHSLNAPAAYNLDGRRPPELLQGEDSLRRILGIGAGSTTRNLTPLRHPTNYQSS